MLGYDLTPETVEFEDGTRLALAGQIARANGQPDLWVMASPAADANTASPAAEDEEDPLAAQEEILTKQVFAAAEPPRWILLFGTTQLLLIDRLLSGPPNASFALTWKRSLGGASPHPSRYRCAPAPRFRVPR